MNADLIIEKLKEYLALGSCDGKIERREKRKELAEMIGCKWNDEEQRIEK